MSMFLRWMLLLFGGPQTEIDEQAKAALQLRVDDHERRLRILEKERRLFRHS